MEKAQLKVEVTLDDTTYLPEPLVDVWIDDDRNSQSDAYEHVRLTRDKGKWSGTHQVREPVKGVPVVVYVRAQVGTKVVVKITGDGDAKHYEKTKTATGAPYLIVGELS